MTTKPKNIVVIENQLAIKWSDGKESFVGCEKLRLSCPCANCSGEKDVFGNMYFKKDLLPDSESNSIILLSSFSSIFPDSVILLMSETKLSINASYSISF